jgi:hypothetical protein
LEDVGKFQTFEHVLQCQTENVGLCRNYPTDSTGCVKSLTTLNCFHISTGNISTHALNLVGL